MEEESPAEKNAKDKLEFTHQGRYVVRSQGHEIGLTNEYPLASVRSYEIKINKPQNWALRRELRLSPSTFHSIPTPTPSVRHVSDHKSL